jgi:ribosomal protein S12 methylthiotransferase accessory factor
MRRALAELCQLVDSLDEVDRATEKPRGPAAGFERALRWWMRNEHVDNHPYLIPSRQRKPLGAFPDRVKKDLRAEVLWCVAQAKRLGLEVLVLDMTRPDIDFPVVRVVVPGMRHCWARMAPGRLYDVPVLLAWRDRALEESELNPISYFL